MHTHMTLPPYLSTPFPFDPWWDFGAEGGETVSMRSTFFLDIILIDFTFLEQLWVHRKIQ